MSNHISLIALLVRSSKYVSFSLSLSEPNICFICECLDYLVCISIDFVELLLYFITFSWQESWLLSYSKHFIMCKEWNQNIFVSRDVHEVGRGWLSPSPSSLLLIFSAPTKNWTGITRRKNLHSIFWNFVVINYQVAFFNISILWMAIKNSHFNFCNI